MRQPRPTPLAGLVLVALLPACGAADRTTGRTVVRDSAGVTVVENRAPGGWDRADAWRVASEPSVAIGALDGEPEYQLHRVRGAVHLTDGRIVIANAGTHQLRAYSADGGHLWSAGGEGGGPGEFESMRILERIRGDTLLVYDSRHRRVSFFTADGDFVRSVRPSASSDVFLIIEMALDDGTFIGRTRHQAEGDPSEPVRDTLLYHVVSRDGAVGPTLGRFPTGEQLRRIERRGNMVSISTSSLPFARWTYAAAGGDRTFVGTSDRWEIRVYRSDGTLARLIRRPDRPPRELTSEIFDRYIEHRIATIGEAVVRGPTPNPAELRETLRSRPRVPTLPAFTGLAVDDAGNLWVRDLPMPWQTAATVDWSVYDADGRLLGSVAVPADVTVNHISDDALVGTVRDELDVQHVHVYPLHKPDP